MIRFKSLGSGSTGNATVIQARCGTQLVHLLVDCGLGIRELDKRLGAAGMLAEQIDAVFITHEHGDHVGCARQLALRERIPVWMSEGTYAAIGEPDFGGLLRVARDGAAFEVGGLQVRPFTVPHDAREPLQLTCTDGDVRLGVLTDLGHVTAHVQQELAGCATLVLECNHDEELLRTSSYPPFLKRRVGGAYGPAGALVVLLTWVYYAAIIVLVGAELTHGLSLARGEPVRPQPQADKTDDTHPPG